jgi:glycosyltransferase involved in cell wall biosynthesis
VAQARRGGALNRPLRIYYVVYWGALEPLGRSLVLPTIRRLTELGVEIRLFTFEKAADLHPPAVAEVERKLHGQGTAWARLTYHKRPRLPATAFDVVHGWARGVWMAVRHGRPDVIHGRTFVGGVIGRLLAITLRRPFIYHNEGFYPDEQVDGGFWAGGSVLHRVTSALERWMYGTAAGIVALSSRGAAAISALPDVGPRHTPVIVVPSCTDLEVFCPSPSSRMGERRQAPRFLYTGAVGGRYLLDRAASFTAAARRRMGDVRLTVLTREDPAVVERLVAAGGLEPDAWTTASVAHREMPLHIARHDVGLFFLARGISEHGCSPTKVGEYWACGRPVVTTAGVSDLDELIATHRAGVVLRGHQEADYDRALDELQDLLREPDLPARCRQAAEAHYALAPACVRQLELYSRVARGR